MFVRSFADSDGDGIGDLRGLIGHLDQLNDGDPTTTADLGIGGIWLMPIAESPSYHGYDVVDARTVERDYGTAADVRDLIAAAHRRGIGVITDLVLNHTSDENPWFLDSAAATGHRDWYIWSGSDPGYGGPDGQAVWHPSGDRYYYGVFGPDLPDLNLRNADVTTELEAVAGTWLTDVGVDGFRLDAIKHLVEDGRTQVHTPATHDWLRSFRAEVQSRRPDGYLVGEVYDLSAAAATYVPDDVDQVFDFGRAQATIDSIIRGDAGPLTSALTEDAGLFGGDETATFLTNHDQDRIASQLREDPAAERLAAALLLTDGGTPFLYYGEELGLPGAKPDERIRSPLPWDGSNPAGGFTTGVPWEPLVDGWQTRNVAAEAADPGSLRSAYRDLIALRAANPALLRGKTFVLTASDPAVHATLRLAGSQSIVVVANLSAAEVSGVRLSADAVPLCAPLRAASVLYRTDGGPTPGLAPPLTRPGGGFGDWAPLASLPARSAIVIRLEP